MTHEPADAVPMSPGRALAELRRAAERRRARLHADIARLRADRGAESTDDEHDPEGVTLSAEWSRLAGLAAAAASEVADIDAALARIDEGTYGVCVDCGRPIAPGRLEARPTAMRCIDCESRASG